MPTCFVIMPFKDELNAVYRQVKEIVTLQGFNCVRADEIAIGNITKNIFHHLANAQVVIADLTQANPNVFYELGISHCIGSKTIMITQEDKIPFDVTADFVIKYGNNFDGLEKLKTGLNKSLSHIKEGGIIDNPAQMFLPKNAALEKLNELNDLSEKIIKQLALSRMMEMKFTSERFGFLGSELQEDYENWKKLVKDFQ
jgi:hypothetical protein